MKEVPGSVVLQLGSWLLLEGPASGLQQTCLIHPDSIPVFFSIDVDYLSLFSLLAVPSLWMLVVCTHEVFAPVTGPTGGETLSGRSRRIQWYWHSLPHGE